MKVWNKFVDTALPKIAEGVLDFVWAMVILIVGFKLVKFLVNKLAKSKGFQKIDKSAQSFFKSFLKISADVLILIMAISKLGIPMASIIALLGSAGLAVGLALQGGLTNVAGGVLILMFKPFAVGDYIKTENGHEGTVMKIDIFYTTLKKSDNTKIVVPNGTLSNEAVYDVSHYGTRRVDLKFSTSYKDDVKGVIRILLEVAARHELVLDDPAPFAALENHGQSSLDFVLKVWTDKDNYWTVYYDLCTGVKEEFDLRGIEIPYPQMDIHIKENKSK